MHLYVHVPFCARRCSYCDFAISVRREVPGKRYVDALLHEWRRRIEAADRDPGDLLDTIYFGGGTPSLLPSEELARLIAGLTDMLPVAADPEVTIEVNPDDVGVAAARNWFAAGVNRISLGVQSHDPGVLRWMHRSHHAEQVEPAFGILREAGFRNISADLIFAVPAELGRDWDRDIALTLALSPEHLSLYGLTVEQGTPLGRWVERGEAVIPDDREYATEYLAAHRQLIAAGFEHYEVSNAAMPGHRSRHNSAHWLGEDYIGLGPSAHSHWRGIRSWNIRNWAEWERAAVAEGETIAGSERPTPSQRRLESRYLGLRTSEGLPAGELPPARVAEWVAAGWARLGEGRVRLGVEGWLRLDALVAAVEGS